MNVFLNDLADAISRSSGAPFCIKNAQPVHGGDISRAFRISDGAHHYFVKTQPATRAGLFEGEAAGLNALTRANAMRVPRVICRGVADGQAYLVLEYLSLHSHGNAVQLGRHLAAQHRVGAAHFGGPHDNWLGTTPQPNVWGNRWAEFWRHHRLGFQFRLAAERGHTGALQRDGEILLAHLDVFFAGYAPSPSLLHGDLWGGNHGYLADGSPVVFDPAVYFGDRECDLAMTELFGGFAPAFHAAYRESWPLDAGYPVRKTLYNLYHILNHVNLFGGSYVTQATRMTAQLLAHIR